MREHLRILIGADTTKLNAALNRSTKMVDRWSGGIKNRLVGTFGSAALGYGAMRFVSRTVEYVAHMNTLAKRTGIAVEEMQRLDRAARLSEVSIDELVRTINKLEYKRGLAIQNPNSSAARGFAGLGIDPLTATKMQMFRAAGSAINTKGYDKVALFLNDLFEETAPNLIETFSIFANDSLQNMKVISSDTADEIERLSDALKEVGQDIQTAFAPMLTGFIDFLRANMAGLAGAIYNTNWREWLAMMNPFQRTAGGQHIWQEYHKGTLEYMEELLNKRTSKEDVVGPLNPDYGDAYESTKKPVMPKRRSIYSDSLLAVGNFLGASGQSAVLNIYQKQLRKVEAIERNTTRMLEKMENGGLFV